MKLKAPLLVSIIFLSCIMSEDNEMIMDQNVGSIEQSKDTLTYLALGDSYTIGESVSEDERWPVQLASKASGNGTAIGDPVIIAKTGWTTDELQKGIEKAQISGNQYDLVSLLIGVNNQYRGYDIEIFKKEFQELLNQAIDFSGGNNQNVFVVSIPDYGVTPFASGSDTQKIYEEIIRYNRIKEDICAQYNIAYLQITEISREAKSDPNLIADDRLHPSGEMYRRWVDEVIYPWLEKK